MNYYSHLLLKVFLVSTVLLGGYIVFDNTDRDYFVDNFDLSDENLQNTLRKYQNFCIPGSSSKLTPQEKYSLFLKGPCSPIILVPGLLGTSLQVKIECETLKNENPEIFKNCGWGTCSSYNIFQQKPDSEYRLWVSDVFSPAKITQFSQKTKCFGDLISLSWDPKKLEFKPQKGLHISYYERNKQECGAGSIKDLTKDIIIQKTSCSVKGFSNLILLLENMGYQSGVSYQAIPYDFRYSVNGSETKFLIKKGIEHLFNTVGKKVVVLAHSLGNLHTLEALGLFNEQEKQQKIHQYVAATPPYLGAPKSMISLLGGDPDYLTNIMGMNLGLNFYSQYKFSQSCGSIYDLLPKNTFESFEGQKWLKEIHKRIQYENQIDYQLDEIPFQDIFPSKSQECFPFLKNKECKTGLIDLNKEQIINIEQQEYFSKKQDIHKILQDFSIFDQSVHLHKQALKSENIITLANPQVPTAVIFTGVMDTPKTLHYKKNTKEFFLKNNDTFYFPDLLTYANGDSQVPSYSALIPAFKWAYEFNHRIHKNNKPIKIIEYCSHYNKTEEFYNNRNQDNIKSYTKNSYLGLPCSCDQKEMEKCTHSCFINDPSFIQLMAEIINTGQQNNEIPIYDNILQIIDQCPVLK